MNENINSPPPDPAVWSGGLPPAEHSREGRFRRRVSERRDDVSMHTAVGKRRDVGTAMAGIKHNTAGH